MLEVHTEPNGTFDYTVEDMSTNTQDTSSVHTIHQIYVRMYSTVLHIMKIQKNVLTYVGCLPTYIHTYIQTHSTYIEYMYVRMYKGGTLQRTVTTLIENSDHTHREQ